MQVVCGIFDQTALRLCSAPVSECSAGSRVLSAVRRLAMQLVTAQKQWVNRNAMKRECLAVPTLRLSYRASAKLICF